MQAARAAPVLQIFDLFFALGLPRAEVEHHLQSKRIGLFLQTQRGRTILPSTLTLALFTRSSRLEYVVSNTGEYARQPLRLTVGSALRLSSFVK